MAVFVNFRAHLRETIGPWRALFAGSHRAGQIDSLHVKVAMPERPIGLELGRCVGRVVRSKVTVGTTSNSSVDGFYAGREPRLFPFYFPADAARYLKLPTSTVRSWIGGREYADGRRFKTVVLPDDPSGRKLSFTNLVELHVLSVIRGAEVPMPKVRRMLEELRQSFGYERPLADVDFHVGSNRELYAEHVGALMDSSRQMVLDMVRAYVERIERDSGVLARLYPFPSDAPSSDASRIVVCDPKRRFGRPHITGTGVETSILADLHRAGDSVDTIAEVYELRPAVVVEALRFERIQAAA